MNGRGKEPAAVLGFIGLCVIVLFASLWGMSNRNKQQDIPAPSQSAKGTQDGLWDRFPASCKAEGAPIPTACLEGFSTAELDLMTCKAEDGNQDGTPCLWADPDTRNVYWISGAPR